MDSRKIVDAITKMKISNQGKNKLLAYFNKRNLAITANPLHAVDTATGEIVTGGELRSVGNLVRWHLATKRESNELPVVKTLS